MKISIHGVDVFVYRAPIDTPVMTSFGTMYDRPAVVIRLRDADGYVGWGEIWCNYPTCGAEHRARLVETIFAPLVLKMDLGHPEDIFSYLTKATHTLALQTAEIGPIAQVIAGIDIAIWDIFSQKRGLPLYEVLGGKNNQIPIYASGINPTNAIDTINHARENGFNAFKVKIGFGHNDDIEMISNVYKTISKTEKLMADANQAWTVNEAIDFLQGIEKIPLTWLEEPIQADRPQSEWRQLSKETHIPIAAGENIRGFDSFIDKIKSKTLGVIQPDICKWGGISANQKIAKTIIDNNIMYCPHFLGGGIGLIASAHLLAAVGGDGMLEVDFNTNPLREGLATPFPIMQTSKLSLQGGPGLGAVPNQSQINNYLVYKAEVVK